MTIKDTHHRIDCNWLVKHCAELRARLLAARLQDVASLEDRLAVKIAVRAMDYNELRAALEYDSKSPQSV
jgi:hypothetical protein